MHFAAIPGQLSFPCLRQHGLLAHVAGTMLLLCLMAGCGKQAYETVPVSGRVTLDGKPLANVGITFVPLAVDKEKPNVGPGSLGKTDAEGNFRLHTTAGDDGAVPTEHIVRMSLAEPKSKGGSQDELAAPARKATRSTLPRKAEDGTLRCKVPPEGTDQANFELVSDPVKRRR